MIKESKENDTWPLWLKIWLIVTFFALIYFCSMPIIGTGSREWTLWQLAIDIEIIKNSYGQILLFTLPGVLGIIFIFYGLSGALITNSKKFGTKHVQGILYIIVVAGIGAILLATGQIKSSFPATSYDIIGWDYQNKPIIFTIPYMGTTTYDVKIGLWLFLGIIVLILITLTINDGKSKNKHTNDISSK